MEKLAYSIREAVKAGAGSRTKIYEALAAGTLKGRKRGRRTIILTTDLVRYLESLPDFRDEKTAA